MHLNLFLSLAPIAYPQILFPRSFSLFSSRPIKIAVFILSLLLAVSYFIASPKMASAQSGAATLEKRLGQEEKKARNRRASLKKLSNEERSLDVNLAKAERSITSLENNLEKLQASLEELAKSDTQAEKDFEAVKKEQEKTLSAQQEVIRLLWRVQSRRESIGSREMLDWDKLDREHRWSLELLKVFNNYQAELADQQKDLEKILAQRVQYAEEIENKLKQANTQKEKLLASRLEYSQRLRNIRKEREDGETELANILKLVESLNFQLEKTGANIAQLKGRLPWPVSGSVKLKYAPKAKTPRRGIGISASEGTPVKAVAPGKVVHNDILRGFGTVLILQHSGEYYSLYAFLGQSPLKLGQDVVRLQRIGSVGFYPDLKGSGLYFELRSKQTAINPEQWLSSS